MSSERKRCSPSKKARMTKTRVCRVEGCDTVLSIYNPSDVCASCNLSIHVPVRVRGK